MSLTKHLQPKKDLNCWYKKQNNQRNKTFFKSQYAENTLCPICERVEDTQEHVGCCPVLLGNKPQATLPMYQNIYGDVYQRKEMAQIYLQLLQLCDELLEGGTDQSTSIPAI